MSRGGTGGLEEAAGRGWGGARESVGRGEGGGFFIFFRKTGEKSKNICAIQKKTLSLQTKGERPFA